MRNAMLRTTSGGTPERHVVVGTFNGFVLAVKPGRHPATQNQIASELSYASPNLGEIGMGLDVGDLDGDPDDEIVFGTWIDTGTFVDWIGGLHPEKNRGGLYVLDPVPGTKGFVSPPLRLDGDDLMGTGKGIGSGVTGVRIDDVNADGTKEIWCSDAVGHLWLFVRHNGAFQCRYRSDDLGVYPGCYGDIFPIKDPQTHKTVKLAVVSPGYVLLFGVDANLVNFP